MLAATLADTDSESRSSSSCELAIDEQELLMYRPLQKPRSCDSHVFELLRKFAFGRKKSPAVPTVRYVGSLSLRGTFCDSRQGGASQRSCRPGAALVLPSCVLRSAVRRAFMNALSSMVGPHMEVRIASKSSPLRSSKQECDEARFTFEVVAPIVGDPTYLHDLLLKEAAAFGVPWLLPALVEALGSARRLAITSMIVYE